VVREAASSKVGPFVRNATLALSIAMLCAWPAPGTAQRRATSADDADVWRGGVLLDEPARDALRLDAHDARETAASVSDVLLATNVLGTTLDALAAPLARGEPRLAWEATGANVLALAVTLAVGEIVKRSVGRARPFERACRADASDPACRAGDTFASFYSLHTGLAFTSAGSSCALHLGRSIDGDAAADAISCGASLALAAATGLLRIAADRHYLSDVVVGAVLGLVVGFVLPSLLVAPASPSPSGSSTQALGGVGVQVSGTF
jgi:membrane-associated phospholipid phosphatase